MTKKQKRIVLTTPVFILITFVLYIFSTYILFLTGLAHDCSSCIDPGLIMYGPPSLLSTGIDYIWMGISLIILLRGIIVFFKSRK